MSGLACRKWVESKPVSLLDKEIKLFFIRPELQCVLGGIVYIKIESRALEKVIYLFTAKCYTTEIPVNLHRLFL